VSMLSVTSAVRAVLHKVEAQVPSCSHKALGIKSCKRAAVCNPQHKLTQRTMQERTTKNICCVGLAFIVCIVSVWVCDVWVSASLSLSLSGVGLGKCKKTQSHEPGAKEMKSKKEEKSKKERERSGLGSQQAIHRQSIAPMN